MSKFNFSESESYLIDIDVCHKINEKIDKLVLTNMANNSYYLNLYYLRLYMSAVITRYISILHKNNKIKNREDMQKIIDEVMSVILIILSDFNFHNQLHIAISLFINQMLLLIYDGIDDFCVTPAPIFNHIINYEEEEMQFKNGMVAIIEPIIISDNKKQVQNINTALNIINTMNEIFDYDAKVIKIHLAVIVSGLWVQNIDKVQMVKNSKIDEIIPDNNINLNDFGEFRRLLLKNEYNIAIINEDDEYNNTDNIIDEYSENNEEDNQPSKEVSLDNELDFNLQASLNYIAKETTNIFQLISNKTEVNKNNTIPDGAVYESLYNYINQKEPSEIDIHLVNQMISQIYDNKNTNEIKENKKDIKTNKINEKINKNDNINILNIDKIYTPEFDADGYTAYVGDCLNADTNKFVINFTDYMKDILGILKKQNIDYKKKTISEIAKKYNHFKNQFTVSDVIKKKDIFKVKVLYKDIELVLTIPNKDDIISNISYKRINVEDIH